MASLLRHRSLNLTRSAVVSFRPIIRHRPTVDRPSYSTSPSYGRFLPNLLNRFIQKAWPGSEKPSNGSEKPSNDYYLPKLRCVTENKEEGRLLCFDHIPLNERDLKVYYTGGFLSFFSECGKDVLFEPYKVDIRCKPNCITAHMDEGTLKIFIPDEVHKDCQSCFEIKWQK